MLLGSKGVSSFLSSSNYSDVFKYFFKVLSSKGDHSARSGCSSTPSEEQQLDDARDEAIWREAMHSQIDRISTVQNA